MEKPLIFQLFTPEKAKSLAELYKNETDEGKLLIKNYIGQELSGSDKIVNENSLNQIVLITSQALFLADEKEPVEVAAMILYVLNQHDFLPKVTEQHGKELASKCFISLSFFRPALEHLTNRHGAPSPNYYAQVGKLILKKEKMLNVAEHFDRWTLFLAERFV